MPKANVVQANFTSGEISPIMRGRVDTTKYANGADELLNFIVLPQGGIWRRPGLRSIATVDDNSKKHRIIPFQFSSTQAYILVFGDYTLQIVANDAKVDGNNLKRVESVAGPGAGDPIKVLVTSHGFSTGNQVTINDTEGLDFDGTWTITKVNDNEFTLNGSTYGAGGWTTGTGWLFKVGVAISLTTPYGENDLAQLYHVQSADVLWVCHPSYQTRTLKRFGANNWAFEKFETEHGPYLSSDSSLIRSRIINVQDLTGTALITTAGPHRLEIGTYITISDVGGATELNGDYRVTVRDNPQQFTITGTPALSAYTSGGIVEGKAKIRLTNYSDIAEIYNNDVNPWNYINFSSASAGHLVEFLYKDEWVLCKYLTITNQNNATVQILENRVKRTPPDVRVRNAARYFRGESGKYELVQSGGYVPPNSTIHEDERGGAVGGPYVYTISTSNSNVFGYADRNKFFRVTGRKDLGGPLEYVTNGQTANNWFMLRGSKPVANSAFWAAWDLTRAGYTAQTWTPHSSIEVTFRKRTITCLAYADLELYQATDVGRMIMFEMNGIQVHGKITAVNVANNYATVTLYSAPPVATDDPDRLANNGLVDSFKLGAWSNTTGWPATAVFHEQRLAFARTAAEPQTVWMSVSGDFPNFAASEETGEVLDDSAITYSFASNEVNAITWMQSGPVLLIGTIGGEWQVRASTSIMEPITPTNIAVTPQTTFGSIANPMAAIRVGPGILFVQRGSHKVYDMQYSFELDSWQAADITVIAEHILRKGSGGFQMVYQAQPYSTVWVLTNDGKLAGFTFDRDQQVAAWHWHEIADADSGTAVVESIAVIPDTTLKQDILYLMVKYTVDGSEKRHLEKMMPFEHPSSGTDFTGFLHQDFASQHEVNPAAEDPVLTGLSRLEGETVNWIAFASADNTYVTGTAVVAAGQITPDTGKAVNWVNVGFDFTSRLHMLPLEGGSIHGSAQGKTRRIPRFAARVYRSVDMKVGVDTASLDRLTFESDGSLASGDYRLQTRGSHDLDDGLYLVQDIGLPLVVLAVFPEQTTTQ